MEETTPRSFSRSLNDPPAQISVRQARDIHNRSLTVLSDNRIIANRNNGDDCVESERLLDWHRLEQARLCPIACLGPHFEERGAGNRKEKKVYFRPGQPRIYSEKECLYRARAHTYN